jgi:flavin reductase (DIM6/NTAB) family NADH-FMN oxidoreductase RutF
MDHSFLEPSNGGPMADFRSFMARFPTGVAVVTTWTLTACHAA